MIETILRKSECNQATSNPVLNEMLMQVREETGKNWQVLERREKRWWKERVFYLLCCETHPPMFQIMNFYNEHSGTSTNITNSADVVVSFLYGILAGLHITNGN